MQVITPITLDLTRSNFPPPVAAKQGDSTRYILASITDNGVPWTIPSDVIGIVGVQKPDGTECWYEYLPDGSPAVTFAGSTATFALAPAALEAAGEGFADVSLYSKNNEKLTTFGFRLIIERAAATENEITSSDYYSVLTKEIAAALRAAESVVNMQVKSEVLPANSAPTLDVQWDGTDLILTFGLSPGVKGDPGVSFRVNSTTTLAPDADAYVENVGTLSDVLLNFFIPQGKKGDTGSPAGFGSVTSTAETLAPGQDAYLTVTATGPDTAKAFAFAAGIPKGDKGDKGDPGIVTEITGDLFAFYISEAGNLILTVADDATPPPLSIDDAGHLIYTIE